MLTQAEAEVELDKWFQKLAHSVHPRTMTLQTQGRKIKVKQTAAGVASFEFDELWYAVYLPSLNFTGTKIQILTD